MKKLFLALLMLSLFLVSCGEKKEDGTKETLKESVTKKVGQSLLKTEIEKMQKTLPQEMGDGLVLMAVELKEGNVVYSIKDKKNGKDVYDTSEESLKTIKTQMLQTVKSQLGDSFQEMLDTKVGLKYTYKDKNDEHIMDILLTSEELAKVK